MDLTFTYIDWAFLLGAATVLFYVYSTWTFDYFKKRNVPFIKPVPLLGNISRTILRKEHQILNISRSYAAFPNSRYSGFFEARLPFYIIRDPQLIRQIGVKDFDHFQDHRSLFDVESDPLFGNNLVNMKGQKWRDMRATLSPAFTGSKMKIMYTLVSDCAQEMSAYLIKKSESGPMITDIKDMFLRYTNDVIATSAFGIKVDSLGEPENEFYKMGKQIIDFTSLSVTLKITAHLLCPKLMQALGIPVLDSQSSQFLRNMVLETMKTREQENIIRPDMINLLMQARKGALTHENQVDSLDAGFATVDESSVGRETHKRVWTDDEIAAQAIIFFFAGFETTSTLLCFAAHELAVNHDVQKTLLQEIDEAKQHGTPTYESIQKLNYLDMVLSETLRKWPPAGLTDRLCVKTYTINDSEGNPELVIEKGDTVLIPIYGIHHDPQYYSDPERFDPERFSEENKKNIKNFTYMPFGVGPRNCIGSRFALMETKAVLFHILSNFTFEVCSKTTVPMTLTTKSFEMKPENGFWLELKPRTESKE